MVEQETQTAAAAAKLFKAVLNIAISPVIELAFLSTRLELQGLCDKASTARREPPLYAIQKA